MIRLVQVRDPRLGKRVGLVRLDGGVVDLTGIDAHRFSSSARILGLLESDLEVGELEDLQESGALDVAWTYSELENGREGTRLLVPIEAPEIWGAGITYERSLEARREESGNADFYDLIYEAERPELFLKTSNMLRVSGPHEPIGVRSDSKWTVPEPELAVVIGAKGQVVAYTIGNDVTARDIEAANPLYLPQAKIFRGSCALGPSLLLADSVDPTTWTIKLSIRAGEDIDFFQEIEVLRMARSFDDLVSQLCANNEILPSTVLMTGTGIVPDESLSLDSGYVVEIEIEPIGTLINPAVRLSDGDELSVVGDSD